MLTYLTEKEYGKCIPISKEIWNSVFKVFRFERSGIYSLAMSYLKKEYIDIKVVGKTESEKLGIIYALNDSPTMGISFSESTMNYSIHIPSMVAFFNNKDISESRIKQILISQVLPHEIEHLLRMHIPRNFDLSKRSKVIVPLYGSSASHIINALTNYIADAQIDNSLNASKCSDYFSYDKEKLFEAICNLVPIKKDKKKELEQSLNDIYSTRSTMLEYIFYKIESFIDKKEVEKQQQNKFTIQVCMGGDGNSGAGNQNVSNKEVSENIIDIIIDVDSQNYVGGSGKKGIKISSGEKPGLSSIIKDDVSIHLLKNIKKAGYMRGDLEALINELDSDRYDIDSFLHMIVEFSVTNAIRFSKRVPARRPNAQAGITRMSHTPKVAIAADASGSVDVESYMEFFRLAKTVAEEKGADVYFIIFDGDVTYTKKGVPDNISKSNGGTNFMPPIQKALKEGYNKILMLTDMSNFDIVDSDLDIDVIYIMEAANQKINLKSTAPVEDSNLYIFNTKNKTIIPFV